MGHEQLNREKREIIERLLNHGCSMRKIASLLGYSASAISQEIVRNSEYHGGRLTYHSDAAQRKTDYRRKRYKMQTCIPKKVVSYVSDKLKEFWSPEQIHGRLRVDYPSDPGMRISFKTIYRWIERSKRSVSPLGRKVRYTKFLRFKRQRKYMRQPVCETRGHRNRPCITTRPKEAAEKKEFGHWEGDMVLGYRGKNNVVTMVEMSTGFLIATYCKNKQKETVAKAIIKSFENVDEGNIKTITLDRGSEFSSYEKVQKSLDCRIYFCHPQTPNERALNEQTNGLLRQFYPKRKGTDFIDPEKLTWAVNLINQRPRKKHNYRTTWEVIEERGLAEVLRLV